jgi:hypothetical protein
VHQTVKGALDADVALLPTEEQVNKSAKNICMRMLYQANQQQP